MLLRRERRDHLVPMGSRECFRQSFVRLTGSVPVNDTTVGHGGDDGSAGRTSVPAIVPIRRRDRAASAIG